MKGNFKKYFGEGILIVFSVLFALMINRTSENIKTERDKNNALNQIKTELIENQKILKDWMITHKGIVQKLNNAIANDSIINIAHENSLIPIEVMFYKNSLIREPLSNSAWNSAQSIGVVSEFDFEILQKINQTYDYQKFIREKSIDVILERYLQKATDIENTKKLLIELRVRFQLLQGLETTLKQLYSVTIESME